MEELKVTKESMKTNPPNMGLLMGKLPAADAALHRWGWRWCSRRMARMKWLKARSSGRSSARSRGYAHPQRCPLGIPLRAVDAHPAGLEIVMFTMQGAILAVWR